MNCPHFNSAAVSQLIRTTNLGYRMFRCKVCRRTYNERTDSPFNFVEVPTDIIFQVLLSRVRYKLSYRDVAELFLLRGFEFTHETVSDWEERFLPLFTEQIRIKRKGKIGKVWLVDETYVKVAGQWCYLYRGIDENGNLVDVCLSATRDMIKHRYYPTLGFGEFEAAQRFCKAVDEVKNFLRPRNQIGEFVSLSDRRNRFLVGIHELELLFYSAVNT